MVVCLCRSAWFSHSIGICRALGNLAFRWESRTDKIHFEVIDEILSDFVRRVYGNFINMSASQNGQGPLVNGHDGVIAAFVHIHCLSKWKVQSGLKDANNFQSHFLLCPSEDPRSSSRPVSWPLSKTPNDRHLHKKRKTYQTKIRNTIWFTTYETDQSRHQRRWFCRKVLSQKRIDWSSDL